MFVISNALLAVQDLVQNVNRDDLRLINLVYQDIQST